MLMKTAISLPDALFEAAEQLADRLGMSRSELYATALAAYVERHRDDGVTERLDAVYAEQGSHLDAELMTAQLASVPDESWDAESPTVAEDA